MILDTNAVSALFSGDSTLSEKLAQVSRRHHLPVIVIGEYRFGLVFSHVRDRLLPLFDSFVRDSIILRVDESTAQLYSEIRGDLRRKGRPIPENDVDCRFGGAASAERAQPRSAF